MVNIHVYKKRGMTLLVLFHVIKLWLIIDNALKSLLALERDINGDVLWTWSYPSISDEDREFYTRKSRLGNPENMVPFLFSQRDRHWYYILSSGVEDSDHLPKVIYLSSECVWWNFCLTEYVLCNCLLYLYGNKMLGYGRTVPQVISNFYHCRFTVPQHLFVLYKVKT